MDFFNLFIDGIGFGIILLSFLVLFFSSLAGFFGTFIEGSDKKTEIVKAYIVTILANVIFIVFSVQHFVNLKNNVDSGKDIAIIISSVIVTLVMFGLICIIYDKISDYKREKRKQFTIIKDKTLIQAGKNDVDSLGNFKFSQDINKIQYKAFNRCNSVQNIVIPDGVEIIEGWAFEHCKNLKNIFIPKSVVQIDKNPFFDTDLQEIVVDENNENYSSVDGVLFNKDKTVLIKYPTGRKNESYTIPEGVVEIDHYAFMYNNNLKNITIPNSLNLTDISVFSPDIKINIKIDNPKFLILDNVLFTKDKTVLIRYWNNKENKTYSVPEGVTKINPWAFFDCDNLESIEFPNSLIQINNSAFECCSNLKSIKFSDGVDYIGLHAFYKCKNLKNIIIPGNIKIIDDYAFRDCENLEEVIINEGTTFIGRQAFQFCQNLKSIKLPKTIDYIGYGAFACCSKLKTKKHIYKSFNSDMTADGKQYKLNEWSKDTNYISFKVLGNGHSFTDNLFDIFSSNLCENLDKDLIICLCEVGNMTNYKSCYTNKIKPTYRLSRQEIIKILNQEE